MVYHYTVILGVYSPTGPNSYPLTASVIPEALITALVQVHYVAITSSYQPNGDLGFLRLSGLPSFRVSIRHHHLLVTIPSAPGRITRTHRGSVY